MFRCAVTGKITKPGEGMTRLVIETRPRTYTNFKFNQDTLEVDKIISHGYETVKEIQVSEEGLAILEAQANLKEQIITNVRILGEVKR